MSEPAMGVSKYNLEYQRAYNKANPWMKTYRNIMSRMNLPKTHRNYKHYHKIKNYLTPTCLKYLWERDKAYLLNQPSIDRRDSKKNYTVDNCRYIEWKENSDQGRANRKQIVYGKTKVCVKCLKRKLLRYFRPKGISHLPHLRHKTCIACKSNYDKTINPRSLRRVN